MPTHPIKTARSLLALSICSILLAPTAQAQFGRSAKKEAVRAVWVDGETRRGATEIALFGDSIGRLQYPSSPQASNSSEAAAAALIDPWSQLGPAELAGGGRGLAYGLAADALPPTGSDPNLAASVGMARHAGVAATFLQPGGTKLVSGIGCTVLLRPDGGMEPVEGTDALVVRLGSSRGMAATSQLSELTKLRALFEDALSHRDSLDKYEEKLEEYEEKLEEYEKKRLEEIEKKKAEKKAKKKGAANGSNGEAAKGDQKKKGLKRPKRPSAPSRSAVHETILRVLDGELPVRVEAHTLPELRCALDLASEHGLDMVLLGGTDADLLADEIAHAELPIVLAVESDYQGSPLSTRDLYLRYRTLIDADCTVALSSGRGGADPSLLLLRAGEAVAAGAPLGAVWDSLTQIPAELLGLEARYGSVRTGFSSDLLLFGGASPFDASGSFRLLNAK